MQIRPWGMVSRLGQVSPHWGRLITCPDAPFPAPMTAARPTMVGRTGARDRRLPRCPAARPETGANAPARTGSKELHLPPLFAEALSSTSLIRHLTEMQIKPFTT